MNEPARPSRRRFFKAAGAAGVASAVPAAASAQQHAPAHAETYLFFNPAEAAFIEAAVARLIPKDETGPGAMEAGVPAYLDRQLAGAWGTGERLYRSGPWREGTPSQGYQLPFTPQELFRNAIRALNERHGDFVKLAPQEQDKFLDSLHSSKEDLGGVPASVFFESLLEATIEGFFSDPAHGGNRDMVAWKMIGFPGAYADFYELVDQHGLAYNSAPTSLAEDGRGRIHIHPVAHTGASSSAGGGRAPAKER
ncbi:MAG: gluconate 2-dehydrogenase subunit 3 family protein [Betaproteobacteria bacterium]|nr:gluconate 2-dehydrogenase subunit 3 family protein [Betaproteobacteria bacterium]